MVLSIKMKWPYIIIVLINEEARIWNKVLSKCCQNPKWAQARYEESPISQAFWVVAATDLIDYARAHLPILLGTHVTVSRKQIPRSVHRIHWTAKTLLTGSVFIVKTRMLTEGCLQKRKYRWWNNGIILVHCFGIYFLWKKPVDFFELSRSAYCSWFDHSSRRSFASCGIRQR